MNEDQVSTLTESLERIRLIEAKAADLFYEELFRQRESLRERFAHTDMTRLKGELMRVIEGVVGYLAARDADSASANTFIAELYQLGQRHRSQWHVQDDDYELAKAAFMSVLGQAFAELWDNDKELKRREIDAWSEMFDWLADTMILGANKNGQTSGR